jgi:hypothetical protein
LLRVGWSTQHFGSGLLANAHDGIAHADAAPRKYSRRYASKTSRPVIPARTKRFFKTRARMTFTRHLEHGLTDAELLIFQPQP